MPQSRRQSPCSLTPAEALGLSPEGLVLLGQQLLLLPPGQPPLHGQQLQALGDGGQAASGLLLDLQLQGLDRLCHVRPAQGSLQGVLRRGAHGTSREHGLGQHLATGVCWRPPPPRGQSRRSGSPPGLRGLTLRRGPRRRSWGRGEGAAGGQGQGAPCIQGAPQRPTPPGRNQHAPAVKGQIHLPWEPVLPQPGGASATEKSRFLASEPQRA